MTELLLLVREVEGKVLSVGDTGDGGRAGDLATPELTRINDKVRRGAESNAPFPVDEAMAAFHLATREAARVPTSRVHACSLILLTVWPIFVSCARRQYTSALGPGIPLLRKQAAGLQPLETHLEKLVRRLHLILEAHENVDACLPR